MSPHGSCFACTFSLQKNKEKKKERNRKIHSSYIMPNLPKENKSYKHQIIKFKKNRRSSKNVMVVCILDLCSSI